MPFEKELIILHQFVHTIEQDVLIPLISSGKLGSYVRTVELSPLWRKTIKHKHTVLGLSITSRYFFGIDYYGHVKKSIGVFESTEARVTVPVIQYQKIPEKLIRTYLKDKNTAISLKTLNKQLQNLIQGNNNGTEHKDSMGEETNLRRERRIFESMFET